MYSSKSQICILYMPYQITNKIIQPINQQRNPQYAMHIYHVEHTYIDDNLSGCKTDLNSQIKNPDGSH